MTGLGTAPAIDLAPASINQPVERENRPPVTGSVHLFFFQSCGKSASLLFCLERAGRASCREGVHSIGFSRQAMGSYPGLAGWCRQRVFKSGSAIE